MQRITALWHDSPLKLVSALFVLSLAAMMAVASGASFTSTSANAGNVVATGVMSHTNSKPGAILSIDNLAPEQIQLERTRVLEGDGVTHMHYRVDYS